MPPFEGTSVRKNGLVFHSFKGKNWAYILSLDINRGHYQPIFVFIESLFSIKDFLILYYNWTDSRRQ